VIGDTVNLASRLESINKLYCTSLILSEETYRMAQHVIEARELDLITVAGKAEPVRIYEAMGRVDEIAPEQIQLREMYANGLAAYRRQDWMSRSGASKAASSVMLTMDRPACLSNASACCAAVRRRPIGTGFGILRRNDRRPTS
jgi:phage-related baseplate assembly protein